MKTKAISTLQDVRTFLHYVIVECGLGMGFHPDDDFATYRAQDGSPLFSMDDAARYNQAMDQCFAVCTAHHADIYGTSLEILNCK